MAESQASTRQKTARELEEEKKIEQIELEHQQPQGQVNKIQLEHEAEDNSRLVEGSKSSKTRRYPWGLFVHGFASMAAFTFVPFLTCPLFIYSLFAIAPHYRKKVKEKKVGDMTIKDLDQILDELNNSGKVPENVMDNLKNTRDDIENGTFQDKLKTGNSNHIPTRVGISGELPGSLTLREVISLAQDPENPNLQVETIEQMLTMFNYIKQNSEKFNAITNYDGLIEFAKEAGVNLADDRNILPYIANEEMKPILFNEMKRTFDPKILDTNTKELEQIRKEISRGEQIMPLQSSFNKLGSLKPSNSPAKTPTLQEAMEERKRMAQSRPNQNTK